MAYHNVNLSFEHYKENKEYSILTYLSNFNLLLLTINYKLIIINLHCDCNDNYNICNKYNKKKGETFTPPFLLFTWTNKLSVRLF